MLNFNIFQYFIVNFLTFTVVFYLLSCFNFFHFILFLAAHKMNFKLNWVTLRLLLSMVFMKIVESFFLRLSKKLIFILFFTGIHFKFSSDNFSEKDLERILFTIIAFKKLIFVSLCIYTFRHRIICLWFSLYLINFNQ